MSDGKPTAFDDPHWDIPQTVAWIANRDPCISSEVSEREYRNRRQYALSDVLLDDRIHDPMAVIDELRQALARGDLACLGKKDGIGTLAEIPADLWADLEFATTDHGTHTFGLTGPMEPGTTWTHLRVRRKVCLSGGRQE